MIVEDKKVFKNTVDKAVHPPQRLNHKIPAMKNFLERAGECVLTADKQGVSLIRSFSAVIQQVVKEAVVNDSNLRGVAKGFVIGFFDLEENGRLESLRMFRAITEVMVKSAAKVKGDVMDLTQGLMEGAKHCFIEHSLDPDEASAAVVAAAITAAYDVNFELGDRIKQYFGHLLCHRPL